MAARATLLLVECNTDLIAHGDILELNLDKNNLRNKTKKLSIPVKAIQPIMKQLLKADGLIKYFKKHKGLKFDS